MEINRNIVIKAIAIITLLILLVTVIYIFTLLNKTTMYKGVTINNIQIGGLNRSEALDIIKANHKTKLESIKIQLKYNEYDYLVSYTDLGLNYDYYRAVEEALSVGREGSTINRLKEILSVKSKGKNISMDLIYEKSKIDSMIDMLEADINDNSKDAYIEYKNNLLIIVPEVIGKKVNRKELEEMIMESIHSLDTVNIPVEEDIPEITAKLLGSIKGAIGTYTTSFKGSSSGRIHNIKLSAQAINQRLIMPSETFSFNYTTGNRGRDAGYQESKIIVNGDYTSGIGGGVCQVSTTLYNAALLSGLEIRERHPHSIPASYVKKGQDATVAYDYLDLKIRNTFDYPIFIVTEVKGDTITAKIFGDNSNNAIIKVESIIEEEIEPEIEKTVDTNLQPGQKIVLQEGRYGYKVKTYKITYENNKEVSRQLISEDFYKPRKYIIKEGPTAPEYTNIDRNDEQEEQEEQKEQNQ